MISVIMSTYNEPVDYVKKAIDSILSQTYTDFEFIIIIDNPDNYNIRNLVEMMAKKDSRIHYYINECNMGLTRSLNKALSYSKGDYIARMDADDISYSCRLADEMAFLNKHSLDIVGSTVDRININGVIVSHALKETYKPSYVNRILRIRDCIPHPTWLVRKETYNQLNGYREIPCNEDYDFLLRALSNNSKIGLIGKPLLGYRINENGITIGKAFKTFLGFSFLQKNSRKINRVSVSEILEYIQKNETKRNEKKFNEARDMFQKASDRNVITSYYFRLKAIMISRHYRKKVVLLIIEKIIHRLFYK